MSDDAPAMPMGTVTFLLTDIEGSTVRWEASPETMAVAVARHYEILDAAISAAGGFRPVEQGEGDSLVATFSHASEAVAAALTGQRDLLNELGATFKVRMALHTGETRVRDDTYYAGPTVIRTARLRACGHGGQVLLSGTTSDIVADSLPDGASLVPLGRHRLRDLSRPEDVWQLAAVGLPGEFPPLASLDAFPTNLPHAVNDLIGRVEELTEIGALLRQQPARRVVTLVGPGGVGKTRLAMQVAAENVDLFPDGVWWVDLASVDREDGVAAATLQALGLPEAGSVAPVVQLVRALQGRHALLVLDNCEHVIEAVARLVDALLGGCPNVIVLATSREPLGSSGETMWRVPSLSLPESLNEDLVDLEKSDAVRLLLERVRQARSGFELSIHTAPIVAEICRRLDGIPLALELAAARIRVVSVERVHQELNERLQVFTGGARAAMPRQQTLLASVEWSHDLLNRSEQTVFRRLAVFLGSFSVEAAQQVCSDEDLSSFEVLALLGHLVDKSLVQFDDQSGRYRQLETMRQYAWKRCQDAAELDPTRSQLLRWALDFLTAVDSRTCDRAVLNAIDTEYTNLRSALDWASERDLASALKLVAALGTYWGLAGRIRDAFNLADPVLAATRELDPIAWAEAVGLLAWVRVSAGDVDFISTSTTEAAAIAQAANDPASEARCRYGLALAGAGESSAFELVHELATAGGDKRFTVYGAACTVGSVLGTDEAEALIERVYDLAARAHFEDETLDFLMPGWVAQHHVLRGHLSQARTVGRKALTSKTSAPAAVLPNCALLVYAALEIGDDKLLAEAVAAVSPALREFPGCEWWIQLLDDVQDLRNPERSPSTLPVPPPLMLMILVSHVVTHLLLADNRFDEATGWVDQIPASWPSAYAQAKIGRAWIALQRADPEAVDLARDALTNSSALGLRPSTAEALEILACCLAGSANNVLLSARLLGAALAARVDMELTWRSPHHQRAVDAALVQLEIRLTGDLGKTLEEGAKISLDEATSLAQRRHGRRDRPNRGWASLSPTEVAVAREIATGQTTGQVAERLFVAPSTVKSHLEHIYTKLAIGSRAALATEVSRHSIA